MDPQWGEDRIHNMLDNRPDWCISRQRSWGVPIPAVACSACQHVVLTPALIERAAAVFDVDGADAWYRVPLAEFVPDGTACPSCGGTAFDRETNILDVWFDSGASHEAVLGTNTALSWPADVYLEGSDQYRGWFQSSLLVGLGRASAAPYRAGRPPHGCTARRRRTEAMSKSHGNAVEPQEVIKQHGAEIIRLWAAIGRLPGRRPLHARTILGAGGRGLSQAAQHAALPRVEPLRLRSGTRHGAARPHAGGRPLRARPLRGSRDQGP